MKPFSRIALIALATLAVPFAPAAAQVVPRIPPARPPLTMPEPAPGFFPQLPPSRSCNPSDLFGGWKLDHVYENPASQALIQFSAQPNQYLYFRGDNTYIDYKSAYTDNIKALMDRMKAEKTPELQQFLMDKSGFIFYYKKGLSIDTQACFIVTNPISNFLTGQMLLMPPEGQATTRLVKQYNKIDGAPPVVSTSAAPVRPKIINPAPTAQSISDQQKAQMQMQQQIDQQRQQQDLRQQQIQQQRDRIAAQKLQNQQQIQLQQQQEQINQMQAQPPTTTQ